MNLVREIVPVPLEVDRGEAWSLFTFLEGELLESVPEHSGAAAEALAKISRVQFESQGWINSDGTVTAFSFGDGKDFVALMLENDLVRSWIGKAAIEEIVKIQVNESERRAELNSENRLVHGDFNPSNVLIKDGVVSGILDWEFSLSGTPYMDIGNLLRNTDTAYHNQIRHGLGLVE